MQRMVIPLEENTDKTACKSGKDYTIEDVVVKKAMKSEIINSCWRKLCPDAIYDFRIYNRANQGNHKSDWTQPKEKKWVRWVKAFKIWIL